MRKVNYRAARLPGNFKYIKQYRRPFISAAKLWVWLFLMMACHTSKNTAITPKEENNQVQVKQNDSLAYYRKRALKATADEKLLPIYKRDIQKK